MRLLFALLLTLPIAAAHADNPPTTAGPTKTGFLLPNGWHLTPAGKHLVTSDLVLNILPLKDNRQAIVSTCGYNTHQVMVVDLAELKPTSKTSVAQSWFGLAATPDESKLILSGGGSSVTPRHNFTLQNNQLTRVGGEEPKLPNARDKKLGRAFASGICVADGGNWYALDIDAATVSLIDANGAILRSGRIGGRPYDVKLARNGLLYVSDWARSPRCRARLQGTHGCRDNPRRRTPKPDRVAPDR